MKQATVEGGDQHPAAASPIAEASGLHNRSMKIYPPKESSYSDDDYEGILGETPSNFEVWGWYLYEFCSYFVQTVIIPVIFPLIISQLQHLSTDPVLEWQMNHPGMICGEKQIQLHRTLTKRTITVSGSHFSSLEWTSIGWASGLALAVPSLGFLSSHLDGHYQPLITTAATGVGAFFCLPAGFFKTTKIFIPYIAAIVLASTVATASHARHLGRMIRAQFAGPAHTRAQFLTRQQRVSSKHSLNATAAGSFGAAIIASFTYHMLREPRDRDFFSLWIVSIFSGLIWLVGVLHAVTAPNRNLTTPVSPISHPFSVFKYPHAIGGLIGVFISSFATMCIFTAGVLFVVGPLCVKPVDLLYFWLVYFLFPLFSLPLMQPFQQLIKLDSVKMNIMGFFLSLLSSGFGFYFWNSHWKWGHVMVFGAIQSTGTGLLHAFGRVLVLDCAPHGKEGAFSVWYAWMRSAGLCLGFTVASVVPGHIKTSFGAAFCAAVVGCVVLLFGNVSGVGGAVAAGHVMEDNERGIHHTSLGSKESIGI